MSIFRIFYSTLALFFLLSTNSPCLEVLRSTLPSDQMSSKDLLVSESEIPAKHEFMDKNQNSGQYLLSPAILRINETNREILEYSLILEHSPDSSERVRIPASWILDDQSASKLQLCEQNSYFCLKSDQKFPLEISGRARFQALADLTLPVGLATQIEIGVFQTPISLSFPGYPVQLKPSLGDIIGCPLSKALKLARVESKDPVENQPEEEEVELAPLHTQKPVVLGTPQIEIDFGVQENTQWMKFEIRALHGSIFELPLELQKGMEIERINFDPTQVFHLSESKLLIPSGLRGYATLYLKIRENFPRPVKSPSDKSGITKIQRAFQLARFPGVKILPGTIKFFSTENLKVEEISFQGFKAFNESIPEAKHAEDLPVLKIFSLQGLDGKLKTILHRLPATTLRAVQVIDSRIDTVLTSNRKAAHNLYLDLLNHGQQSISIPLKNGVRLLGATLNDRPVKSFFNDAGEVMIQLFSQNDGMNSQKVKLKIQLLETLPDQDKNIELKVPSPRSSLRTNWKVYYPSSLALEEIHSNLQKVKISSRRTRKGRQDFLVLKEWKSRILGSLLEGSALGILSGIGFFIMLCLLMLVPKIRIRKKWMYIFGGIGLVLIVLTLISIPNFRQARMKSTLSRQVMDAAPKGYKPAEGLAAGRSFGDYDGFAGSREDDAFFDEELELEEQAFKDKNELRQNRYEKKSRRKAKRRYAAKMAPKPSSAPPMRSGIKSEYSKIRRSGVKPVEIRIPSLNEMVHLRANTPLDGNPTLSMKITKKDSGSSLPWLGMIFGVLSLLFLSRNQYLLGASGFCAFLLLFSVSPSNPLLGWLLLPFGFFIFLRLRKVLIPTLVVLFYCSSSTQASSYLQQALRNAHQNMRDSRTVQVKQQAKAQDFHSTKSFQGGVARVMQTVPKLSRRSVPMKEKLQPSPTHLQIYEILNPKTLERVYPGDVLVSKKEWLAFQKDAQSGKEESNSPFSSQYIKLKTDIKHLNLEVEYRLNLAQQSLKPGTIIFDVWAGFQIEKIQSGQKLIGVRYEVSNGQKALILGEEASDELIIKAHTPLVPTHYHESFQAYIPVVKSPVNRIELLEDQLGLLVDSGLTQGEKTWFSASDNLLNLKLLPMDQIQRRARRAIQKKPVLRSFQTRESSLDCNSTLSWQSPYFYLKNQAVLNYAQEFKIPRPGGSVLTYLKVQDGRGNEMIQGISYGLEVMEDFLRIQFHQPLDRSIIDYEWLIEDSALEVAPPFSQDEFKKNRWVFQLAPKKGQSIQAQESQALGTFSINRFQSGRRTKRFQNLQGEDLHISIEKEEKTAVRLSSTRCSTYLLHGFVLSPKEVLIRMVLVLMNRGSQFLELDVPKGMNLEFARINDEALIPLKKDENTVLIPLKKYPDESTTFQISLDFKQEITDQSGEFSFKAPIPKTNVDQLFVQLTTNLHGLGFTKGNIGLKKKGKPRWNLPGFPRGRGKAKALNFSFPQGKYRWYASRYGIPSEIQFNYRFQKSDSKEAAGGISIPWGSMVFLLALGALFQWSQSRKLLAWLVLVSLPFLLVFAHPLLSYFTFLMAVFWLCSQALFPAWDRVCSYLREG